MSSCDFCIWVMVLSFASTVLSKERICKTELDDCKQEVFKIEFGLLGAFCRHAHATRPISLLHPGRPLLGNCLFFCKDCPLIRVERRKCSAHSKPNITLQCVYLLLWSVQRRQQQWHLFVDQCCEICPTEVSQSATVCVLRQQSSRQQLLIQLMSKL